MSHAAVDYLTKLAALPAIEDAVKQEVSRMAAAAKALENWNEIVLQGMPLPVEMIVRSRQQLGDWPTKEQVVAKLTAYASACVELKKLYAEVPANLKIGLAEPPEFPARRR